MEVVVDVVDVMGLDAEAVAAVAVVAALRVDTQMQVKALEPKLPELAYQSYQKTRPVCLLQEFEPDLLLHQTSWESRANEPCQKG